MDYGHGTDVHDLRTLFLFGVGEEAFASRLSMNRWYGRQVLKRRALKFSPGPPLYTRE